MRPVLPILSPGGASRLARGFLCAALAAVSFAVGAESPPPVIDAAVERAMATFKVPGAAIAIVRDGEVAVAKGYGVRVLGKPERLDANTVLPIASNSKAFTAVALALLVEDGKLEWSDPVRRYLPDFALADPYVSRELTVKDLLVHRSGLGMGAGDLLLFPPTTYDRREVVRRAAQVPLATSFRGTYAYDNLLYVIAAQVVEAVTGRTWERFVEERIFAPVGMASSYTGAGKARQARNRASPHAEIEGVVRPIPPLESEVANPSGGIHSTARDMAEWVRMLLGNGRIATGARLYGDATARELLALVTPMPIGQVNAGLEPLTANFRGYALGFIVQDYRGRKMAWHTGGLPGVVSRVTLFPNEKLGIVVLTNQESAEAFNAITFAIADHYLGAPAHDWVASFEKVLRSAGSHGGLANGDGVAAPLPARDASAVPALPPERYAGLYRDPWYGDVEIATDGGGLRVRFRPTPAFEGTLEPWQRDTFIARWKDRSIRADAYVTFVRDAQGQVREATMRALSDDAGFNFDFQDLRLKRVEGP
jgi:CubicO group peptidase (beta-lactamase class C family)